MPWPRFPFVRHLTAVLLLGPLACEGKTGRPSHTQASFAAPGSPAAPLDGKLLDGAAFRLADKRGTVVLVNLWATWCAPCRAELPALRALHESYGPRGFMVVGVSTDRASALPRVRAMVAEFQLSYPIVFDPEGAAAEGWSVAGYPTSFLIDRGGRVRWRRDGIIRADDDELRPIIEALLAEPS